MFSVVYLLFLIFYCIKANKKCFQHALFIADFSIGYPLPDLYGIHRLTGINGIGRGIRMGADDTG